MWVYLRMLNFIIIIITNIKLFKRKGKNLQKYNLSENLSFLAIEWSMGRSSSYFFRHKFSKFSSIFLKVNIHTI